MSVIATDKNNELNKNVPVSITIVNTSTIHDVKTVDTSIDEMINKVGKNKRRIYLSGDKGYLMKKIDKDELLKKKIRLITPYRRNQKKKLTRLEKTKLKKRIGVEQVFAGMKNYGRIMVRKDSKSSMYLGFMYLASLLWVFKK